MGKPDSKEFISDYEAQKLLGLTEPVDNHSIPPVKESKALHPIFRIGGDHGPAPDACDHHTLLNLILDFDLIPYRKDEGKPDYEIAHDLYAMTPMEALEEIGFLAFKRADVEALKAIPGWQTTEPTANEHYVKRLEIRRANILRLQQSRDQDSMGPSRLLRVALAASKRQIAYYSKPLKKPNGRTLSSGAKFDLPEGTRWDQITVKIVGDGKKAEITTPPTSTTKRLAYSELGFGDKRGGGQQTERWLLLVKFAVEKNIEPPSIPQEASSFRKLVSNLSKDLKTIFGIQEKPFSNAKKTGYAPKFNLLDRIDRNSLADDRVDDEIGALFEETITDRAAEVAAQAIRKKRPGMDEQSSNKR